jgi:hypothetical protein
MKAWDYIRASRRNTALVAVGALAAIVAALWVFNVGPFASSVDDLVSESLGTPAKCKRLGLTEMAGARTTVYSCDVRLNGGDAVLCRAVIDGGVYTVSDEQYRGCRGI